MTTATIEITPLLTSKQAAEVIGTSSGAMDQMRYLGVGPKYIIIGRRSIRYRIEDLQDYIAEQTVTPGK